MADQILHQTSWAKTAGGRDIELYSFLSTETAPILMIGGVHGDEPEGVKLAQELLSWLQKNNKPTLPWLLIPCLNLDGFTTNQRTNANGVDLNRNFPSQDWSSEAKAPRYFPGKKPCSEPEVQAVVTLIDATRPRVIIHFHSWKPCVVYTGNPGQKIAEVLGEGTGYPVHEDIGYPTPGSLGQYGWLERKTPVICIEAQDHSDLSTIWPIFGPGLQRFLLDVKS